MARKPRNAGLPLVLDSGAVLHECQLEHHGVIFVLEFERESGVINFAIVGIVIHTIHRERGHFVADKPIFHISHAAIVFLWNEALQFFVAEGFPLAPNNVW